VRHNDLADNTRFVEAHEVLRHVAVLRTLIVDDEPVARRVLAEEIAEIPGAEVVGEAANGEAAVACIERLAPDLVVLDIQIASSHTILHNVASGIVPFGVCLMLRPLSRLTCHLLLRARYGVFCGAEHPLFGRTDVTLAELRDMPFISFSCDAEGRAPEPMIALRDSTGLGRNISGTSGDFAEVCRMITAGLGIGVLPIHAVERELRDETLWQLDLPGAELRADLYFVADPARHVSRAEQTFLDIANEVLASMPRQET